MPWALREAAIAFLALPHICAKSLPQSLDCPRQPTSYKFQDSGPPGQLRIPGTVRFSFLNSLSQKGTLGNDSEDLPSVLIFSPKNPTQIPWALGGSPDLLDSFQIFNRSAWGYTPSRGWPWHGEIRRLDRPQEVEEIPSPGWVGGPSGSQKSLPSRDPFFPTISWILKHNQFKSLSIVFSG